MTWNYTPSAAPSTYRHAERPHSCGRCRTPWGVTNKDCPNRPRNVVEYPWEAL